VHLLEVDGFGFGDYYLQQVAVSFGHVCYVLHDLVVFFIDAQLFDCHDVFEDQYATGGTH
jgi:hypothetical protein